MATIVVIPCSSLVLKSSVVKSGNTAEPVEAVNTLYKVFNGWKVNNATIDIATYKITADTVFTADITYKYDVRFMADGNVHFAEIVAKNDKPTLPTTPTKDKYLFLGWSKDGTNIVDINNFIVTENTVFTALFILNKFDVTFMVDGSVHDTQVVTKNDKPTLPTKPTKEKYVFTGWSKDGTTIVDIGGYIVTENATFTVLFKVDKFDVTFKNGNDVLSNQQVDNGGYARMPDFNSETFMGWTVDGTSIVDIATYKITAVTIFTAKYGTWQLLFDDNVHMGGNSSSSKIDVNIKGLKAGEKTKFSTPSITVNDGRNFAGGGFNSWQGFTYVGSGNGNFAGNKDWFENSPENQGWGDELFFSSDKPLETVVGRLSWYENNTMTITISCKTDGVLTIEWSDNADFFIQTLAVYDVCVIR